METEIKEKEEFLKDYEKAYTDQVVILRRAEKLASKPKKIAVFIDGCMICLPVDMYNRLLDSGHYDIVAKKSCFKL